MSVAENMMLAVMPRLARRGVAPDAEMRRRVETLIRALGVRCAGPDQKIRELSGGNQQKVLLGRWLATDPRILILDEPTRGIDVGAKAEIQALIRDLADRGLGVLMISSELEDILEGADRVVVLREGTAVASLPKAQATEAAVMAAMAHGDAPGEPPAAAPA
jgi:ribose transport system ATP-binding protein